MIETLESIRKELETKHEESAVRKSVEELTARCAELETQITEQEAKATQAFNNSDITAYEEAISRKVALQEMLDLTREKLKRQKSVPELSKEMRESYKTRINTAVQTEEEKQVKKMLSLINQIVEILNKNRELSDNAEDLQKFLTECMREPKETSFHTNYVYEYLISRAESLQMRISDCLK